MFSSTVLFFDWRAFRILREIETVRYDRPSPVEPNGELEFDPCRNACYVAFIVSQITDVQCVKRNTGERPERRRRPKRDD